MGINPIDLSDWRKFLKSQGLEFERTKGGHEHWNHPDKPLHRPITFSNHQKTIHHLIVRSGLSTLCIDRAEFEQMLSQKNFVHINDFRSSTEINPKKFRVWYIDGKEDSFVDCTANNKSEAVKDFYLSQGYVSPIKKIEELAD